MKGQFIMVIIMTTFYTSLSSQIFEVDVPNTSNTQEIVYDIGFDADTTDYLKIMNGTSLNNIFIPSIFAYHESDDRHAMGISAGIAPAQDIVNSHSVMKFETRVINGDGQNTADAQSVSNRLLYSWSNFNDKKMVLSSSGNLGINTSTPKSKIQVTDGDVYIETINKGIIMRDSSNSNSCYRITVNNGNLSVNAVTCP